MIKPKDFDRTHTVVPFERALVKITTFYHTWKDMSEEDKQFHILSKIAELDLILREIRAYLEELVEDLNDQGHELIPPEERIP